MTAAILVRDPPVVEEDTATSVRKVDDEKDLRPSQRANVLDGRETRAPG